MAKIRIIAVPPGDAPEWVRQGWVGLELPLNEESKAGEGLLMGVLGGPARNQGGYAVNCREAIDTLVAKHPQAGGWWLANTGYRDHGTVFVFKLDVCELVQD
jgi:hypothetical protein